MTNYSVLAHIARSQIADGVPHPREPEFLDVCADAAVIFVPIVVIKGIGQARGMCYQRVGAYPSPWVTSTFLGRCRRGKMSC